ncbi:hypothetical protein [Jannaschia sp. R86511]|uniref:hypothetical protein n=1 Tax=Jannaschia sp. R86511 TaxID=3093853 RepID=UPI0036D214CD
MSSSRRGLALLVVTAVVGSAALRRFSRWGATGAEVHGALPGDELVPHADVSTTRAITVRAPAETVWPWLVQIGQGRGGFYSYDGIENLLGLDIHSADRVMPEHQSVAVGDTIRLAAEVPLAVAVVEPDRALVLQGSVPMGDTPAPYDFTWTFALGDDGGGATRLVVRERYGYLQWWARLLVRPLTVVSFVMTRRMLHGVRDRAERR